MLLVSKTFHFPYVFQLVHVKVGKDPTVEESQNITIAVENALRERFGNQTHVGVHIEPFYKPMG
ncbi:MAG: hypothetical protein FD155_2541 [Bacteroidetes bacterium]|nr:MAG: hypothetical protein FD155_2541 [Bacteroidota bacterium]